MMKKILAILLSITFMLFLCACSKNVSNPNTFTYSGSGSSESLVRMSDVPTPQETATTTTSGTSIPDLYKAVLQGQTEFFSTDANENLNIRQINQVINSEVAVTVISFAVTDLGHDLTEV